MKIQIKGLNETVAIVCQKKTNFDIVSIRSTIPYSAYKEIDSAYKNYKSIFISTFDDIEHFEEGLNLATKEQVGEILNWSEDKDNILVHCTAGISRSSAIAYLIAVKKSGIKNAVKVLNFEKHSPNRHIVKVGAGIMKDFNIYQAVLDWKRSKIEQFSSRLGLD